MKGRYTGQRYAPGMVPATGWKGGDYVDERGVHWSVVPDEPMAGDTTWTLQSEGDADARRYFSGDWDDVFSQVDAFAAGQAHSSGSGWVLLAALALLLLTDKRR